MKHVLGPVHLLVIAILVAADWISKALVLNRIPLGDAVAVIDGWLYFAHRQNPGVAFSMFADLPEPWGRVLLSGLSIVVIVLMLRFIAETGDRLVHAFATLVIAGAIGNLGDRLVTGSVTDFVFVTFFPYVFNVADSAITVGGVLLGLRLLFGATEPAREPSPS
jgi:signal peptidase II